jgi:ribosome-binding factor A
MANFQRIDRISEEVRREVDRIIREELNDPRIAGTYSITRAEVTRDLRFAKIFVSNLEDDKRAPMLAALKSAAGYIRKELGRNIVIRYAPELSFADDKNIEYGAHIAKVLMDAKPEGSEND